MSSFLEILKDKRNRLVFIILSCLVVLAVLLIFYFSSSSTPGLAITAVPSDAAMILEVKQAGNFHKDLTSVSGVWKELINFNVFAETNTSIAFLDSLFNTNNKVSEILSEHSVFISFHILKTGNAGILYLTALPKHCSVSEANELIKKCSEVKTLITQKEYEGLLLNEITFAKERKFYYIISKGVFICGFQPDLIVDAVKQQNSNSSVMLNSGFAKVSATAGKKVQANLYVNYNYFPKLFSLLAEKKTAAEISEIVGFAGWSAMDINIKKDALLLNGFAAADSVGGFLDVFSGQTPQTVEITDVIPSSSAAFLCYSFSDFKKWNTSYKSYLQKQGKLVAYNAQISKINKEYNTDVETEITSWIGKEIALVITEPSDTGFSENIFLAIRTNNIENTTTLLSKHSQTIEKKIEKPNKKTVSKKSKNKKSKNKIVEKKEIVKADEPTVIKDNIIYEYKIKNVFPALFGKVFSGVKGNYYAIEGNYVIFGNSLNSLKKFIGNYSEEKNLDNNNNYLAFSKNVSAESNIYLYCNIKKSLGIFMKYANKTLSDYIGNNLSSFKNLDAFSFQVKTNGDMYYCNFCLKTNTLVINESDALWSVRLDSLVYGRPVIVKDTLGKSQNIIAFDNACNMYMINAEGGIKWKLKLKEKPLGNAEVIEYNKNGKFQYLFNTASYLYLVNSDGSLFENFPVKLDERCTASLTLADYSKNKDYRIIIPCGRNIYNYQKNGSPVETWSMVKTKSDVVSKISCLKFNGADCFAVADKSGNIYIFDKKGNTFISIKEQPLAIPFSKFYSIAASGKQRSSIVSTDMKGNIIFISSKGNIDKTAIPGLSSPHFFFYEDWNNDKKKEYIFIDKSKLSVYNYEYKLLGNYSFPADIILSPEYFEKINSENYLGILCTKFQKIYVIDKDYNVKDGYPLSATTMFTIGSLNNDNSYNLVVGNNSEIYNYSFE